MAEIIARFADGRLLLQEDKAVETGTRASGYMFFRIGHVKTVERVLSIDASISGHPEERVAAELRDVTISGDTLMVQLRRSDLGSPSLPTTFIVASGLLSGFRAVLSGMGFTSGILALSGSRLPIIGSGAAALSRLSGVTSGLNYYDPVCSTALVSGILRIMANVIGY